METNGEITTYEIPESNMYRLRDLWARMGKRAAKLGVAAPVLHVGEIVERRTRENEDAPLRVFRFYPVTIEGEAPKLAGWTFVATIQHLGEHGNVVRTLPGQTCPVEYRTGDQKCDQCHVARNRTDTYVVRHDDGRLAQVGSTCIQDFLGGLSPEQAVGIASFYAMAAGYCEDAEGEEREYRGHRVEPRYDLLGVLEVAATMIRLEGWTSAAREKATGGAAQATRSLVSHYLFTRIHNDDDAKFMREHAPGDADKARAKRALDWAEGITEQDDAGLSDYLHNVAVLVKVGSVDYRGLGLATSIVPTAERAMGQEQEQAKASAESNYFGEVGKRADYTMNVLFVTERETDYGTTTIVKMVDDAGNRAVWFASNGPDLAVGDKVRIKATVKKHSEYRGVKETALTRCKVLEKLVDGTVAPAGAGPVEYEVRAA